MIMPLLHGLKITLAHMFKKPITLQYPRERPVIATGFRGLHALNVDHDRAKCVACYLCPTVCPAKCITVEAAEDANHDKYAATYEIDMLRCIFCGYCVEACPVDAILGAPKHMHTVIAAECTGCKLCVAPCPVECIEMAPVPQSINTWVWPTPEHPLHGAGADNLALGARG